jgi:hypothetical protein
MIPMVHTSMTGNVFVGFVESRLTGKRNFIYARYSATNIG